MISPQHPVAYICAEFAWRSDVPTYAGGLGVLARDTLMAAAQTAVPMIGIGLLYQGKDAKQTLSPDGWQVDEDKPVAPAEQGLHLLLNEGRPALVRVPLGSTSVALQVWEQSFSGNVRLWLLDPNVAENTPEARRITDSLYCCEDEQQLQQALLLGAGAFRILQAMKIEPAVYHLNEGRPALVLWELWQNMREQRGVSLARAQELIRERVVYTNHTLLSAGNVTYGQELILPYAESWATDLGVDAKTLVKPGLRDERFSFTDFALFGSGAKNGVSALHTNLCRRHWPQYGWRNVTNGIDLAFWQDAGMRVTTLTPEHLWSRHTDLKRALQSYVLERTGYGYDPNRLVVGWARRITGYKQLDAVFRDIERMQRLFSDPQRPVQLLVAGKAHPGDADAKRLLRDVIQLFQTQLSGLALFVPEYDLALAQHMTRGCDIWLNTPQQGWEACGTSTMKALSNGVLSMSVADGWIREVDWTNTGWILPNRDPGLAFLDLLEEEALALFYTRDPAGVPQQWIEHMQRSVALAPRLSAHRMLKEYQMKLYAPRS